MQQPGVVTSHSRCETKDARFLCIYELYEKLEHPGQYDIGGTYTGQRPDYWFKFSTSTFKGIITLKLFVCNRITTPFTLGVGFENLLVQSKMEIDEAKFEEHLDYYNLNNLVPDICSYIKTFTMSKNEMERLKGKETYIAIKIASVEHTVLNKDILVAAKSTGKIRSLLFNRDYSNVVLESSDGHQFPAHRAILASQSPVFKNLLKDNPALLKLEDVDKSCLEIMLTYIYTGRADDLLKNDPVIILKAALRYSLEGLTTLGQYAVEKRMNPSNVFEILKLAQHFRLTHLLKQACYVIVSNPEKTLNSDEWKSFDNVEAVKTLTEFLCHKDVNMVDGLDKALTEEGNQISDEEVEENEIIY